MARKLGTYMFCIRLIQLLVWLAIFLENGWLTNYILQNRLGLGSNMATVETIAGVGAAYTLLPMFLLHSRHKSSRPRYLIMFIVCDALFMGTAIATMTILSVAGVPNNCQHLTRQNYNLGDAPNNPAPGYATIRFGSGLGDRGELDKYCDIPRIAWGLCIFEIYTYSTIIIFSFLRIHTIKHPLYDPETKPQLSPKPSTTSLSNNATSPSSPRAALPNLSRVATSRHELPTLHNTTELASPVSELGSPITPYPGFAGQAAGMPRRSDTDDMMADVEPSISNGSRGAAASRPERSASVRSGPPPYMPASEGALSRVLALGERKG